MQTEIKATKLDVAYSHSHRWGVILAGGDGKRLLPLTRRIAGDDRLAGLRSPGVAWSHLKDVEHAVIVSRLPDTIKIVRIRRCKGGIVFPPISNVGLRWVVI